MNDCFTVNWTQMSEGTRDDYERLDRLYRNHTSGELVDNILAMFRLLEGPNLGYRIDRSRHSRQSATRAMHNGESTEFVVAALLHDIGDVVAPENHSTVAADILAPYVSEETSWVVRQHGLFQGYYYFHHLGGDRDARERHAASPHYERCIDFCASYDQNCFDPNHDDLPLEDFIPLIEDVFNRVPHEYRA